MNRTRTSVDFRSKGITILVISVIALSIVISAGISLLGSGDWTRYAIIAGAVPALFLIGIFYQKPLLGLITFCVSEYFQYYLSLGRFYVTFSDFILLLMAVVWLMKAAFSETDLLPKQQLVVLGITIYIVLFLVTVPFGSDQATAFKEYVQLIRNLLVILVFASLVKTLHQVVTLLRVLVISSAAQSVLGLVDVLRGVQSFAQMSQFTGASTLDKVRAFGTVGPSYAGYVLLPAILLVGIMVFRPRDSWPYKRFLFVLLFTLFGGIILSKTRGVWVTLFVSLFLAYVFGHNKRFLVKVLLLVIACFLLVTWILPQIGLLGRVISLSDLSGGTIHVRLVLWRAASKMFVDSPIVGHGLGSFATVSQRYFPPEGLINPAIYTKQSAHHVILQIMAEAGIFGLVGFLVYRIVFLVVAWRATHLDDVEVRYWASPIFLLLLTNIVAELYQSVGGGRLFQVMLGISIAVYTIGLRKKSEQNAT